jgi:hypothetical protein
MSKPGFFTLGVTADCYQLPHPRLGLPVILLIRRVLCRAFAMLREEQFQLAVATEDQVTAALRSVIENNLRQRGDIAGFNRQTYESVVRQSQVANFDGTKRSKSPDFCFKLRNDDEPRMVLSEHDALFVECKPVDSAHPAGSKYCDDGLIRFVIGDYAWAMQEGIMVAYAGNGRTIAGHLIPAMREQARVILLATVEIPQSYPTKMPVDAEVQAENIHISEHRRSFSWPDAKGQATNVTIYHLWHDCS